MKFITLLATLISFSTIVWSTTGHARTAKGREVFHEHLAPNSCRVSCPGPNSIIEAHWGFLSSDRIYGSTSSWNCHGRTFDHRRSWIHNPSAFINDDASAICPSNPRYGDIVIFYENSQISHSATIVGSWNGTNTLIMSKYGAQGQYRHSLQNSIRAYGSNWTVLRLSQTQIYTGKQEHRSANWLLEQRKRMPWYQDVLDSEKIFEEEGLDIARRIGALSDQHYRLLEKAKDDFEEMDILVNDFTSNDHYVAFSIYNSPAFSEHLVHNLEAGLLLFDMATTSPEHKTYIQDKLKEIILSEENPEHYSDPKAGTALFYLFQIMDPDEAWAYKTSLQQVLPQSKLAHDTDHSYFQHYLGKVSH